MGAPCATQGNSQRQLWVGKTDGIVHGQGFLNRASKKSYGKRAKALCMIFIQALRTGEHLDDS